MTTQLALMLATDPTDPNADAKRHVIEAICLAAELNHGRVSANHVRDYLAAMPEWPVPRGLVGKVYRELRHAGRLVEVGTERSTDTAGGNAGRIVPLYRLVEETP